MRTRARRGIQSRELWSTEERRHLRLGHFWGAELGDADGTFTRKNESFTLSDGRKMRGDAGDCLLLLHRYFHRTPEDLVGLTFRQWQAAKGEILVVSSSELRAVQGHQKNDFVLRPINPPKLRQKTAKKDKSEPGAVVQYGPRGASCGTSTRTLIGTHARSARGREYSI